MSDLMRKEFEAACEARFNWATQYPYRDESESALSAWNGESYRSRIVQGMWWAWQASRERLVIELPKPAGLDRMSSEMSIQEIREDNRFNRALELAKKELTAAGVKYK